MPIIEIYVLQSDFDAAERLAKKMSPNKVDTRHVLATALDMGLIELSKIWNDTEDQANAKEGQK